MVATDFPESGFLVFDVSDPAQPQFQSWFRGSKCEGLVIDVDCGAFVDLSADGRTVFMSVQSLSVVPSSPPDPGVRPVSEPGVEVVDVSDPAAPQLDQVYPVASEGGVHTARSFTVPSQGAGTRAPGDYVASVANGIGIDLANVESVACRRLMRPVGTLQVDEAHDMFVSRRTRSWGAP